MRIDDDLSLLEHGGLIDLAQLEPELEYLFHHELMRDTVYHNMVRHMRKGFHHDVALAVETLYADRLDELAPVLAHHFDEAGDVDKALHYLTRSGDIAFAKFASAEAILHYTRALALARDSAPAEEVARMYGLRGQSLEHTGLFAEAFENFAEMRRFAEERGQPQMVLDALMAQTTIRSAPNSAHDSTEAKHLSDEALVLAHSLGNREAEATILWNQMLMYGSGGDHTAGVAAGERSLVIARELNLRRQLAFTLNDLASHAYIEAGMYAKARAVLEEACPIWVELGDKPMLSDSLCGLSLCAYTLGDFDAVFEAAAEARAVSESINNLWGQSYSRFVVSDVLFERGRPDEAIPMMHESIALGKQAGFVLAPVGVGSYLAHALGRLGQFEAGIAAAREAVAAAQERLPVWAGWPISALTRVQIWSGDIDGAEATFAPIRGSRFALFPIGVEYLLAETELLLARGDAPGALSRADDLLGQMRAGGTRLGLADTLFQRAHALVALGRLDEARDMLAESRGVAEEMGIKRILWQILLAVAQLDAGQADALRAQARAIVEEIAANIADPAMRQTFLSLPAVQAVGD